MNTAAHAPQAGSLNLGMIGNCAISALIDDHARMVWCCLPRFDGDPVFNALLQPGDEGSHFAIELEDLAQHRCMTSAALRGWLSSARTTLERER